MNRLIAGPPPPFSLTRGELACRVAYRVPGSSPRISAATAPCDQQRARGEAEDGEGAP